MAVGLFLEKKFVAQLIVLQKDLRTIHIFSNTEYETKAQQKLLRIPYLSYIVFMFSEPLYYVHYIGGW